MIASGLGQAKSPPAVMVARHSLFKLAKDERFQVKFEQNKKLLKQGLKENVWSRPETGIWFTLYFGGKAVAMAVMSEPDLSLVDIATFSPNIAYVVAPEHRGKKFGSVVAIHAGLAALIKYEAYQMGARVTNTASIRVILGTAGAMKAIYGKKLHTRARFIRSTTGNTPVMILDVWIEPA